MDKNFSIANTKELQDKDKTVKIIGNADLWVLVCKVYSEEGLWMKATKAMNVPGRGVLVQASTQCGEQIAEALTFIPDAMVDENHKLIGTVKED